MKENKQNRKTIVIVISILIVLLAVLGLTYAYLSTTLNGSDQIVKIDTLDLILNETSEGINLDTAIGVSDSKGMSLTPSTFTLVNNGDKAVDYTIYLDDMEIDSTDTRIDDNFLKYNLNKNGTDSGATLLTRIGTNPNRVLDSGTIEGRETNTYSLNIWITDEVDGNYSGQVFKGKLRVEVSQERQTVAEVLLDGVGENGAINTSDPDQTFITGTDPNNYIWYSGKLWRAVSIDPSDNSVKLVTQWNISAINYSSGSASFEGSYMEEWLNDISVDGFLGNLREPEKFIKMDSIWNATMMTDETTKPTETTLVTDPVGLLNIYEYTMSYSDTTAINGYLNNVINWWTLTPSDASYIWNVDHGRTGGYSTVYTNGVRPSINLKSSVKIAGGDGTIDNPYRLNGDDDTNLLGTLLSSRYSGEYIRFGTGENNLYRIVNHENGTGTKITSAEPLKKDGSFISSTFGNGIEYSSSTTIGSFLNNDYLNTDNNYLTDEDISIIEDNTTWYLGTIGAGTNYKLAKYTDTTGTTLTSSITTAKVGLLRYGELMAGQFDSNDNNTHYWTLTPYSTSYVWSVSYYGRMDYFSSTVANGVRPSLNLKQNVIITSGDGTLQNPFTLALP